MINGVARVAWTPINVKPIKPTPQNRILKTVLSSLNLRQLHANGQFSISELDNNSKIAFPSLFAGFAIIYWIFYNVTEGSVGGGDDEL